MKSRQRAEERRSEGDWSGRGVEQFHCFIVGSAVMKLRTWEPWHPADEAPLDSLGTAELHDLTHAAHEARRLRLSRGLPLYRDETIDGAQRERDI